VLKNKKYILLLDGREISDDEVGISQFITSINQMLRRRKDIICCWPINDLLWRQTIYSLTHKIGGLSLLPEQAQIVISGPSKDMWELCLEKILNQLYVNIGDLGLDKSIVLNKIDESSTIGEFLHRTSLVFAERITKVQKIKNLPEIAFVISSSGEVIGEANRIRRTGNYLLNAENLIGYSTRSESGKWWKDRSKDQNQNLGYIVSLFNARLTTLNPGAVVYSCLHFGEDVIKDKIKQIGYMEHISNARTTMKTTDFYRFLSGDTLSELTSSKKGKISDVLAKAYSYVQSNSALKHKSINDSILKLINNIDQNVVVIDLEVDGGDQNLYTDAIIKMNNELYLEFHHLSEGNCKASSMASYIMGKMRAYAIHYNLCPR